MEGGASPSRGTLVAVAVVLVVALALAVAVAKPPAGRTNVELVMPGDVSYDEIDDAQPAPTSPRATTARATSTPTAGPTSTTPPPPPPPPPTSTTTTTDAPTSEPPKPTPTWTWSGETYGRFQWPTPCVNDCFQPGYVAMANGTFSIGGFSAADFDAMKAEKKQPSPRCYGPRPNGPLRIAAVTFATGRYTSLLDGLMSSAARYFFPLDNTTLFVFTNHPEQVPAAKPGQNVRVLHADGAKWPESSMQRYRYLTLHREMLAEFDYVYSYDVDFAFYWYVCDEFLTERVAVLHPLIHCRLNPDEYPYDRQPASLAYIPRGKGMFYYHAALYGGTPAEFHRLVETCFINMELDKAHGVHAAVDDESHLNRYYFDNPPTRAFALAYDSTPQQVSHRCYTAVSVHRDKSADWMRGGDQRRRRHLALRPLQPARVNRATA